MDAERLTKKIVGLHGQGDEWRKRLFGLGSDERVPAVIVGRLCPTNRRDGTT